MPRKRNIPEGFKEAAETGATAVALAKQFGVSEATALRMLADLGMSRARTNKPLPDDIQEMAATGMSMRELASHYEWNYSTFSASVMFYRPDLKAIISANGRRKQAESARKSIERARKFSPVAGKVKPKFVCRAPSKQSEVLLNFEREKLVAKVTRAMRHLQGVRLGPCYPWKNGYYWMGKCLDEAALMAEAQKWGWVA